MELSALTENGICKVTLSGKFLFSDSGAFRQVIEHISDPDIHQIVLNMAALEFIDSAGLGTLLLARDEAEKHGKNLVVEEVTGQVRKIFSMARFDQLFHIQ